MKNVLVSLALLLCLFEFSLAQHVCLDAARAKEIEANTGRGVFSINNKWLPGQKIRVKFLNGSSYLRGKVKKYAQRWENFANIDFVFVNSGEAEIRVAFDKGGSWSYIGKTPASTSTLTSDKTMNFGWFDANTEEKEFRKTTLHEFGHALGLNHEHQHPDRHFKLNEAKVISYYTQTLGWSVDDVQRNVLNRYSVEHSNGSYDPKSIMHYWISGDFTESGKSFGLDNNILSEGDKKIVKEMYPFPIVTNEEKEKKHIINADFHDIKVSYNVTQDGEKGMEICADYTIRHAIDQKCIISAYFYNSDGTPLVDKNDSYNTTTGKVAVWRYITPKYDAAKFTCTKLFIPYSELHLGSGEHNLKFSIMLWDQNVQEISTSGYEYFWYSNSATVDRIKLDHKHNENVLGRNGVKIYPKFSIKNGKGKKYTVGAYFYYSDNTKVLDKDGDYKSSDGQVATFFDINPCCDITNYSMSDVYHFNLFLPYDELHLSKDQNYTLKYYVVIWDGSEIIAESEFHNFTLDYASESGCYQIHVKNECKNEVKLIMQYHSLESEWETKGWYHIAPGESAYIQDTRATKFYYYGVNATGVWEGSSSSTNFYGANYGLRVHNFTTMDYGKQTLRLTCAD